MRAWLLSLNGVLQVIFIIGATIATAFVVALAMGTLFDGHQLAANTELTASVYQVLGTIYAILLTFTLWGVWQNFNIASASVQNEAYALIDLVHSVEASATLEHVTIRRAVRDYFKAVIENEWATLKNVTDHFINSKEESHRNYQEIIAVVQSITPTNSRETTIFNQTLTLLNNWLDARRTRLFIARGNSAKALWPSLFTGAIVLFAFHGLFVAKTLGIWVTLLFGFALIIGVTFYLIYTLDCPFAGALSIDSEPFQFAVNLLSE